MASDLVRVLTVGLGLTALILASCRGPDRAPKEAHVAAEADSGVRDAPAAPAPAPVRKQEPQKWSPPDPEAQDFDWIKLKSGEWLKGELKYLRDDSLEFESDELDTLEFEWKDVHMLRLARIEDVVFEGRRVLSGTVVVDRESVRISTAEGEQVFPRDQVVSIVPDARSRRDYWSGNLSLGASLQSGNTEQSSVNSQAKLRRRSPLSRISFDYIGNFGTIEGVTNLNSHRADARWDLFLSKRWYATPAQVTWFRDPFQNISKQFVPSAGFGYHLVHDSHADWAINLNAGAQYTEFDSVSAGQDDTDLVFAFIPGTNLDWDITRDLEWTLDLSMQLPVPDPSGRVSHLATTLSLDLFSNLDLDVTFQWDRVANPLERADGSVPEPNDFRLSVGVGWEF